MTNNPLDCRRPEQSGNPHSCTHTYTHVHVLNVFRTFVRLSTLASYRRFVDMAPWKRKIISVSSAEELLSSMQWSYLADHCFKEFLSAEIFTGANLTRYSPCSLCKCSAISLLETGDKFEHKQRQKSKKAAKLHLLFFPQRFLGSLHPTMRIFLVQRTEQQDLARIIGWWQTWLSPSPSGLLAAELRGYWSLKNEYWKIIL